MAPAPPPDHPAVILVAHGSARSGASAEPVLALARALRGRGFPEVRTAFWKEEPFLHQALETTRSPVVVVLHDALVDPGLIALATRAEIIDVGRRARAAPRPGA